MGRHFARVSATLAADVDITRLVWNSGVVLSGNVPVQLILLVRSVIVARALGLEAYGTYVLVVATVTAINEFINFRVWETTIQYVGSFIAQNDRQRAAAALKLCVSIDVATGCIAYLMVLLLADVLNGLLVRAVDGPQLLSLYALGLIPTTVDPVATALLRVGNRFGRLSLARVSSEAISLCVLVVLLIWQKSILMVVIASVIGNSISSLLNAGLAVREAGVMLKAGWWKTPILTSLRGDINAIAAFTVQTYLSGSVKMLSMRGDVLLLGYLTGPTQVGIYRAAVGLGSLVPQLTDPFYTAIYPELCRFWTLLEHARFKRLLTRATIVAAALVLPAGLGLIIVREHIVRVVYGEQFLMAAGPLAIIVFGQVGRSVVFWTRPALLSMGIARAHTVSIAAAAVVQFGLILVLAPSVGAWGAGIAYCTMCLLATLPLVPLVWFRLASPSFPAVNAAKDGGVSAEEAR